MVVYFVLWNVFGMVISKNQTTGWMENLLPATLALAALSKGRLVAAAPGKPCVERGAQSQRLGCGKRWQNVGMCGRCELNTKWLVIFPGYISAFLRDSDRK